jgi:hypothetical protein
MRITGLFWTGNTLIPKKIRRLLRGSILLSAMSSLHITLHGL